MKRVTAISAMCLLFSFGAIAAPKYWIGIVNGKWSDRANWSGISNGSGGAELPGRQDSVIFTANNIAMVVHIDLSPAIRALRIEGNEGSVTLYASTPVNFTLLGSLNIPPYRTLKDSTSEDVPFNFIFSGAAQSQSTIRGRWVFEGRVPVNHLTGSGASFTAEPGSHVNVLAIGFAGFNSGVIMFKNNTNYISSDASSLKFSADAKYILENNLHAAIPDATWSDSLDFNGSPIVAGSSIRITGSMNTLMHSAIEPRYKDIFVDLYGQATDAGLDLPDGTLINGNLNIINTNKRTLTLLAATGLASSVNVKMYGYNSRGVPLAGTLTINENTKVAMATATSASPATSYNLQVIDFNQNGGNFSLQDYSSALGSSMLSVSRNILQTGGSFFTNSITTDPAAKFIVEMNGPVLSSIPCPCPKVSSGQFIRMNGKTIDNGNHMVTLRMSHTQFSNPSYPDKEGVDLQTSLEVGRLELLKGTLNTSDTSIITVTDPSALTAITFGTAGNSYVNGPIRRFTNSTGLYAFPTGKGKIVSATHFDSCVIVPASAVPSIYQAEYFDTGYPDLNATSPLKGVSNREYWNVSKVSGVDGKIQLLLNAPVPGVMASDALVAARYINGHWAAVNGSVLSPGNTDTGSVTSKQFSDLGPFTFGYADTANLPADTVVTQSGSLTYKYYEGGFNVLPDFNTLTAVKTGHSANVDLGIRRSGVNDSFAIVWEGYMNISTPGTYTFETVSDDGSKLYFNSLYLANGIALVDNDGIHTPRSATGTINILAAGRYPIAITFFDKDGGEGIELYWSGPAFTRQRIPDEVFSSEAQDSLLIVLNIVNRDQINMLSRYPKKIEIEKIYPNPFTKSFNIYFYNNIGARKVNVNIYDLRGRLIYIYQSHNIALGNTMLKIDLPSHLMANGVYVAKLDINGVPSKTVKLVKVGK